MALSSWQMHWPLWKPDQNQRQLNLEKEMRVRVRVKDINLRERV